MPAGSQGFAPPGHVPTPSPPRTPWVTVVIVVIALAVVGGVGLWLVRQWPPSASTAEQQTVEVTGGNIGAPVDLTGPDGSGKVTVTGARWTSEGEVAPEPGTRYLIVDVEIEGVSGELPTGGVFTAVVAADGRRYGLSYGPVLDPLLTSRVLRPGDTNTGHLGYQLPAGAVDLEFQTPDGTVLGPVAIPAP